MTDVEMVEAANSAYPDKIWRPLSGLCCPVCAKKGVVTRYNLNGLRNAVITMIRTAIVKYLDGYLVCGEHVCRNRTRQPFVHEDKPQCTLPGCSVRYLCW